MRNNPTRLGGVTMAMEHEIIRLDERIKSLEKWQENQNGTLCKLEKKIDNIYTTTISALVSAVISLVLLALNLLKGKF